MINVDTIIIHHTRPSEYYILELIVHRILNLFLYLK
jgi:hypothetical protein